MDLLGNTISPEFPMDNKDGFEDMFFMWPGIDMSTALSLLQDVTDGQREPSTDVTPGVEDSSPDSLLLNTVASPPAVPGALSKALLDELVVIYFANVHPLLPVVDEYEFAEMYKECSSEQDIYENFEAVLFQAMMFMAFAHLEDEKLKATHFKTISEAQKCTVEKVKKLYSLRTTTDGIVLTQVCLLLSYWSPYDSDIQVNSYWVDRAFHHANTAKIWDPEADSCAIHSRNKIIWWSLLVRDRQIAFGLRRLHRLRERDELWPMVTELDFGPEALIPSYTNATSKKAMMLAFIGLCELSNLIAEIGIFQRQNHDLFGSSSNQPKETNSTTMMRLMNQVSEFDHQLRLLKKQFIKDSRKSIDVLTPGISKVPLFMLPILHASLLTSLYRPFLKLNRNDPLNSNLQMIALRNVRESSPKVIKRVVKMMEHCEIEEVPNAIIAWINYPYAVCQLGHHFNPEDPCLPSAFQMDQVMSFYERLSTRNSGAFACSRMMSAIARRLAMMPPSTMEPLVKRRRTSRADLPQPRGDRDSDRSVDDEVKLLDTVGAFIDIRLAGDDEVPADDNVDHRTK